MTILQGHSLWGLEQSMESAEQSTGETFNPWSQYVGLCIFLHMCYVHRGWIFQHKHIQVHMLDAQYVLY